MIADTEWANLLQVIEPSIGTGGETVAIVAIRVSARSVFTRWRPIHALINSALLIYYLLIVQKHYCIIVLSYRIWKTVFLSSHFQPLILFIWSSLVVVFLFLVFYVRLSSGTRSHLHPTWTLVLWSMATRKAKASPSKTMGSLRPLSPSAAWSQIPWGQGRPTEHTKTTHPAHVILKIFYLLHHF